MERGIALRLFLWLGVELIQCLPSIHEDLGSVPCTALNQTWWCTPVTPAHRRQRQDNSEGQGWFGLHEALSHKNKKAPFLRKREWVHCMTEASLLPTPHFAFSGTKDLPVLKWQSLTVKGPTWWLSTHTGFQPQMVALSPPPRCSFPFSLFCVLQIVLSLSIGFCSY